MRPNRKPGWHRVDTRSNVPAAPTYSTHVQPPPPPTVSAPGQPPDRHLPFLHDTNNPNPPVTPMRKTQY